jgi:hypothetical protein
VRSAASQVGSRPLSERGGREPATREVKEQEQSMSHQHTHHVHGPSAAATVILDIGGKIGALSLETDASRLGDEIEISPVPRDGEIDTVRTHSMVRERHTDPVGHVAVYPDLQEGDYTVWSGPHTPAGTVTITGGQIASFSLKRP